MIKVRSLIKLDSTIPGQQAWLESEGNNVGLLFDVRASSHQTFRGAKRIEMQRIHQQ